MGGYAYSTGYITTHIVPRVVGSVVGSFVGSLWQIVGSPKTHTKCLFCKGFMVFLRAVGSVCAR